MKIYNILDEQKRYSEFIATTEPDNMQENVRDVSYLFMREKYKKMGEIMGLEKEILK